MRKIFVSCFIITAMMLLGDLPGTYAEEPQSAAALQEIDKNIDKDGVALSLNYRYSGMSLWGVNNRRELWSGIHLVVWNDGRVLFCKGEGNAPANWEYLYGKIDQMTIKELQERVRLSFRIANANQEIFDWGADGSYYDLQVYSEAGGLSIKTWEQFDNARFYPGYACLKAEETLDGKPMFLPEFYDVWRTIKAEVLQLGERATAKDAVPVKIVGERSSFTVKDEAGNVLAEYPPKTTLVVKIDNISVVQSNLMPPKNWLVEATVVRQTNGGNNFTRTGSRVSFLIHSPTRTFGKSFAQAVGDEFKIRYESEFRRENYAGNLTVTP